jgi:hypothetical protein
LQEARGLGGLAALRQQHRGLAAAHRALLGILHQVDELRRCARRDLVVSALALQLQRLLQKRHVALGRRADDLQRLFVGAQRLGRITELEVAIAHLLQEIGALRAVARSFGHAA